MSTSRNGGLRVEKCPIVGREKSRFLGAYSKASVCIPSIKCCMSPLQTYESSSLSSEEDECENDETLLDLNSPAEEDSSKSNDSLNSEVEFQNTRDIAQDNWVAVPISPNREIQNFVASLSNSALKKIDSILDIERIGRTLQSLQYSGWYYEGMTCQKANQTLKGTSLGTFILRDSSDPRYMFSLSVQTERGPTSVRIHYLGSQFRLDAEDNILDLMPLFPCVVQLVEYYVGLSKTEKSRSHVWLDDEGRRDLHIRITKPFRKQVPSLQHLCRTSIHTVLPISNITKLQIPNPLKAYLKEYPYTV